MRVIWKFPLTKAFELITMPERSRIISVIDQRNIVTLYAEVETNHRTVCRKFWTINTGSPIPKELLLSTTQFIGTVVLHGGDTIVHVYAECPLGIGGR